jgi:thioester reductase-like protein
VLLTGATGFLGTHLIKEIYEKSEGSLRVRGLTRDIKKTEYLKTVYGENIFSKLTFI